MIPAMCILGAVGVALFIREMRRQSRNNPLRERK